MTDPTQNTEPAPAERPQGIIERAIRQLIDQLYPPDGSRTNTSTKQLTASAVGIVALIAVFELMTRLGYPPPFYWH